MTHDLARRGGVRGAVLLVLLVIVAATGLTAVAHEGHGMPALVQAGSCDELGEAAHELVGVGAEEDLDGLPVAVLAVTGAEGAVQLRASVTTLDTQLDELTAVPHAIVVYRSDDTMSDHVACGNVGGIQLGDELIVGLLAPDSTATPTVDNVDAPGLASIALLRATGAQTTITLVLGHKP